MSKYMLIYHWSDGTTTEDDNYGQFWDSEEDAKEDGDYGLSCARQGGEIMEMSNPGDYPFNESDYDDNYYDIVEVE